MEITGLDFFLINFVSFIFGAGTGLIICCKHKDKLFIKSRSMDNLSQQQQLPPFSPPVMASAPTPDNKQPVKITVE
mgnify:CR=1 FL=1|tara:strand:- start:549 stop:776 length:228 start_codon:yes stop_codon:yes gene_type:complete